MTDHPKPAKIGSPQLQVAQKAFIVIDDALLMVRHAMSDKINPHRWEVPGGRMAVGEGIDDSLRREVMEEVALDVLPGRPFTTWGWPMKSKDGLTDIQVVAMGRLCTVVGSTDAQLPDDPQWDHLDAFEWVAIDDVLSRDLIPNARRTFEDFVQLARAGHLAAWIG